jgi:hypothetical protein
MGRRYLRTCCALAALGLALSAASASAATPEAEVKAAYLYKLASFVRWPPTAQPQATFRLCVAGRSDVVAVLRGLTRGQQIDGRPLAVEVIGAAQASRASGCQVLYLGRGAETARALIGATEGAPVLTVGDRDAGTPGGVIDFVLKSEKVRFAANVKRAKARRLDLSAKLLDVAAEVTR